MSELKENQKTFANIYGINSIEYEEVSIPSLGFSVRVSNRFMGNGITTLKKLLECTPETVLSLNGFGKGCVDELYAFLDNLKDNAINEQLITKDTSSLKKYVDQIALGDFSFINECELSDEEKELVNKYKESFDILGDEIVFDCVATPGKIIPIIEMFDSYNKQVEKLSELRAIIDTLPEGRKHKKAYGYINAFTLDDAERECLKELCLSASASIESMVYSPVLKVDMQQYVILYKFLKWCTFDLYMEIEKLFSNLYANERNRQIIIERAKRCTLEQAGTTLGITRERVRQIEKKVKSKFTRLHSRVRIVSKISAERNGDNVLTPAEIETYCGDYSQELLYLLQSYESKNYFYDQQLDIFVIGDDSIHEQVRDYIDALPNMIKSEELSAVLANAEDELAISSEMVEKAFFDAYKLTGNVYHRSRLSLAAIYETILKQYFKTGIRIYDSEEIKYFRKMIFEEYGDVGIPENDRALIARITPICILCGRGIYKLKQDNYITKELANKIYEYIDKSENSVFLTNTLFSVFEDELLSCGIDNKYYLQGVLHELFGEKFFFKRDYISKDGNITSIYSSIVEYIRKADFLVSKEEIQKEFPGITEVVINFAVSDLNILNYFGEYIHSSKINVSNDEKQWLYSIIKKTVDDNDAHHIKEFYDIINTTGTDLLTRNAALNPFSAFSVMEYLFRNEFQFSRPYIANIGVKFDRPNERLHEIISNSREFSVNEISDFLRENHFQIQSLLEFVNSCNDEFLLVDNDKMMRIEDIGVTREIVQVIDEIISSEITETVPISALTSFGQFPPVLIPWSEWLLYSSLNKWSDKLTVGTSSNQFRLSVPLVAPNGSFDSSSYKNLDGSNMNSVVRIDNLDDIDSLLEDIINEDILEGIIDESM